MATRLLLISDTHIPGRARALPAPVLAAADAGKEPSRRTTSDFFGDPFMDEFFSVATHLGHLREDAARARE